MGLDFCFIKTPLMDLGHDVLIRGLDVNKKHEGSKWMRNKGYQVLMVFLKNFTF